MAHPDILNPTSIGVGVHSDNPSPAPTTLRSSPFGFPGFSSTGLPPPNNNNTPATKRQKLPFLFSSKSPQPNIQEPKMNWLDDIYNLSKSQLDILKSKYANSFDENHPDYLFKNINIHFDYMTDAGSKDSTMSEAGYQFVNHYTIGDLSKYMLTDRLNGNAPQFCQYDMLDRFKKDLLVCGLINDPFSYNNIDRHLRTNLIHTMNQITTNDLSYNNLSTILGHPEIIDDLKNTTTYVRTPKSGGVRGLSGEEDSSSKGNANVERSQSTTSSSLPSGGGDNPYSKSPEYNKFVQWNTLYGEFLHDFTSSRITSVNQSMFFGDNNVEGIVNAGWDNVLKNVFGTTPDTLSTDYDFIRAKKLYDSQPLNETKYVQETIKTIQNNNPDLLYDLDYTPLTTFSTAYYPINMQPDDTTNFNNELSQLYDTFTTSFSGSVIIPRKKVKGSEYCIVFYIFHPKQDYETPKTYKNVDLQMTDMNIDQNAVSARLLYSQIEEIPTAEIPTTSFTPGSLTPSPTAPLTVTPTQTLNVKPPSNYIDKWFNADKTLKMDNVESATQFIDQNIPTLVTYSKGLDPITQSESMKLTEIKANDSNTIYTITQDANVIKYFKNHISKLEDRGKYTVLINTYLKNKNITPLDTYTDDVFANILLECAIGQATIDSMNDLLSIWFDGFSTRQEQGANPNEAIGMDDIGVTMDSSTENNVKNNHLDTFVQLLYEMPANTEYNQIKFMKKPPDSFMFQMGSTTVNNVAQALVEIRQIYNAESYNARISVFKSNNDELIIYANTNPITDKALQSFIVYFIRHINDLHEQFNEIPFVAALLMFVAFAKSCGDELQRLTCDKINTILGENVFILTRDRIFVAKCLAEYTPCISTIILDQLAEEEEDTRKNTGIMKGGGRQGSVQTHGGILISPITSVLTETKTEGEKLKEKTEKLLKLKIELTKRIYAKLNLDIKTLTVEPNIFTLTEQYVSDTPANTEGMDQPEKEELEKLKSEIWECNQHIQKLTVLLDSLEMYVIDDPNYTNTKAIIEVEINTLALRLLSSSEKQFIQQTGTTFPSNTKNMFNAIHILSGNEDITTKLLEIYTTATNCILNRIQTSTYQLQNLANAPEKIEKIYTPISSKVIPTYGTINEYIVTQHKEFLDTVVSTLETERQALDKREGRSRASSSASYVSGTDENIVNKIEDIETEISKIDNELNELSKSTIEDSNEINELLATTDNPDAEKKLNEIGKKYNSFSQKVTSQMNSLFKSFKNTSSGIQTTATKLLASINKVANKKTDEFQKQRDKLVSIIEKQKTRIKQPPPRQTTSTLRTIIELAKNAYSNMNIVLNPKAGEKRKGRFGGKRTTKKTQTDTHRNNRRSNRRIRKIGVLTRKHKPRLFKQNPNRRKTKQNKQ